MSLFPNLDSLTSLMPGSLSFNIGDLDVLMAALYAYRDKLAADDDDPNGHIFCVDDGRDYFQVCNDLIGKFNSYNFK